MADLISQDGSSTAFDIRRDGSPFILDHYGVKLPIAFARDWHSYWKDWASSQLSCLRGPSVSPRLIPGGVDWGNAVANAFSDQNGVFVGAVTGFNAVEILKMTTAGTGLIRSMLRSPWCLVGRVWFTAASATVRHALAVTHPNGQRGMACGYLGSSFTGGSDTVWSLWYDTNGTTGPLAVNTSEPIILGKAIDVAMLFDCSSVRMYTADLLFDRLPALVGTFDAVGAIEDFTGMPTIWGRTSAAGTELTRIQMMYCVTELRN